LWGRGAFSGFWGLKEAFEEGFIRGLRGFGCPWGY